MYLRYVSHHGRLLVTEHDTLEEAMAAQLLDDELGAQLDVVERIYGDSSEVLSYAEVQAARPAQPYFKVIVDRPGHSQAIAGVHEDRVGADAERSRLAGLVGPGRVSVGALS